MRRNITEYAKIFIGMSFEAVSIGFLLAIIVFGIDYICG